MGGSYRDLRAESNSAAAGGEDIVLVFIPSLAAILTNIEQSKGSALTESEVLEIRDRAVAMAMFRSHAEAMAASRGYRDIDPENCWAEWQGIRASIHEAGN